MRKSSAAVSAKQVNNVNWFSLAAAPSTGRAAIYMPRNKTSKLQKKKKNTLWVAEELMLIQTVGEKEGQSRRGSAVFMDIFLLDPTVKLL